MYSKHSLSHACMYECMYIRMHIGMYSRASHMYAYACMYVCLYRGMYSRAFHMYACMCIHTYMHAYVHTNEKQLLKGMLRRACHRETFFYLNRRCLCCDSEEKAVCVCPHTSRFDGLLYMCVCVCQWMYAREMLAQISA